MSGILGAAPVAGWVSLSALRWAENVAVGRTVAAVLGLQLSEFCDGRDDLSGHAQTPDPLVPGDVGPHQPKERGQRYRAPAGAGLGQLQDGLDLAAQIAACHGATRPGSALGMRGSGRDVLRR
jgi:hypothetical protein